MVHFRFDKHTMKLLPLALATNMVTFSKAQGCPGVLSALWVIFNSGQIFLIILYDILEKFSQNFWREQIYSTIYRYHYLLPIFWLPSNISHCSWHICIYMYLHICIYRRWIRRVWGYQVWKPSLLLYGNGLYFSSYFIFILYALSLSLYLLL